MLTQELPIFAAFQHVFLLDLAGHMHSEGRIICRASRHLILRATSFPSPLHTSSWLPFSSSGYLSNFFPSVFAMSTLDVLAHRLILGSVQHLYASSIYVLFLPFPPPFFSLAFNSCIFLFSLISATPCAVYSEGYSGV
jgi:hypothetical protein